MIRMSQNTGERLLAEYCRMLAAGLLLAGLELEADEIYIFSADDLREYYHYFAVTSARAASNGFFKKTGTVPTSRAGGPIWKIWSASTRSPWETLVPWSVGFQFYELSAESSLETR